ncbi:MAG: hypothetical protein AB7F99_00210 [Vicinamibacterales bacterium]
MAHISSNDEPDGLSEFASESDPKPAAPAVRHLQTGHEPEWPLGFPAESWEEDLDIEIERPPATAPYAGPPKLRGHAPSTFRYAALMIVACAIGGTLGALTWAGVNGLLSFDPDMIGRSVARWQNDFVSPAPPLLPASGTVTAQMSPLEVPQLRLTHAAPREPAAAEAARPPAPLPAAAAPTRPPLSQAIPATPAAPDPSSREILPPSRLRPVPAPAQPEATAAVRQPAPREAQPTTDTPRLAETIVATRAATAAPAPAPTPAANVPASAAPETSAMAEEDAVRRTLDAYRNAFERMDVAAAARIWPSVDQRALSRAFNTLQSQGLDFERCAINVADSRADARCRGTLRVVRKVGVSTPLTAEQQWVFTLQKQGADWTIDAVSASRPQ